MGYLAAQAQPVELVADELLCADGQWVMTTYPDGTIVYTPFPDFEESQPATGSTTQRTGNSIAVHRV